MNKVVIISLVVFLVLVLAGGGYYAMSSSPPKPAPTTRAPTSAPTTRAPTSAPTTIAPTSAPTTIAPTLDPRNFTDCNSQTLLRSAKDFYEQKGQWAGQFTMDPFKVRDVDNSNCDIRYNYKSIYGNETGEDCRRFTIVPNPSGGFVTGMGDYMSCR